MLVAWFRLGLDLLLVVCGGLFGFVVYWLGLCFLVVWRLQWWFRCFV